MREKKDINIEIGGNIQVAREQAGYTQDTLSEMLGMTPNHLSAIERGASGISLEALQRLCRLLGVSADRIIFGTDEPEAEALALARRISDIKPEYRQQVKVNSTPFVRQYGILLTNGVLFYAKRSAEQEVYWGIQTGSR